MERDEDIRFELQNQLKRLEYMFPDCVWIKDLARNNNRATSTADLFIPADYFTRNKDLAN